MSENLSDEQLIETVTAVLVAEADAAFPEERLHRQRSRILLRVDQEGRPGRVITFPAHGAPRTALLRTSRTTRWAAAAAAVAFIAGVAAGQRLPTDFRFPPAPQFVASRADAQPTGTTLRASAPLMPSDDEFLGEIEVAVQSRPAVLRHLDALTPRAWDVEVGQ